MLSWRPSGVIIAGLEHSDASRKMLENAGIPVVEIMDTDGKPVDAMVGISHRRAGREMCPGRHIACQSGEGARREIPRRFPCRER